MQAIVLHGDARSVAGSLAEHLEAGANHVCVQVLGSNPLVGYSELASVLFG